MKVLPADPGEAKVLHIHQPTQPCVCACVEAQSEAPLLVLDVKPMYILGAGKLSKA